MRYAKYGLTEFENMRIVPEIQQVSYDHADLVAATDTLDIPIPAGTLVLEVGHLTTEAFAGGTPALNIGDGTDADGFGAFVAADLDTIGDFVTSKRFTEDTGVATIPAFFCGKYYAAAGIIRLTHADGLTAGKGKVFITMITKEDMDGNWRIPSAG